MYLDDEKVRELKKISEADDRVLFRKLNEDKTFGEVEEEVERLEERGKSCSVAGSSSGFWLGCIEEGELH